MGFKKLCKNCQWGARYLPGEVIGDASLDEKYARRCVHSDSSRYRQLIGGNIRCEHWGKREEELDWWDLSPATQYKSVNLLSDYVDNGLIASDDPMVLKHAK